MKYKRSKIVWEGCSWFIAGFVYDLGILLIVGTPALMFEIEWLGIAAVLLAVVFPPALSFRAVRREMRRQRALQLDAIPEAISDPVLGDVVRSVDDPEMWRSVIDRGDQSVELLIEGEGFPDPVLLRRAREFVSRFDDFKKQFSDFKAWLIETNPSLQGLRDEICELTVSSVCFYGPTQPESTAIYCAGGREDRSWHGSLVDGRPVGLSYDT